MRSAKSRGGARLAKRLLVFLTVAIAALVVLVGLPEYLNLMEARDKTQALAVEVARLHQDNGALRERVRSLREDPAAIEDVARRELGMLRRGEILFIVKDVPKPGP